MHRSALFVSSAFITVAGLTGCGSGSVDPSPASGEELSSSRRAAAAPPSSQIFPCRSLAAARLPLAASDITVIGNGPLDMVSAVFVRERGEITVVYETYSDPFLSSGALRMVTSTGCGNAFSAPQPLELGSSVAYQTTPSAVRIGWQQYLYFTKAQSLLNDPLAIYRSRFDGDGFDEPEEVEAIPGADTLLSWPRFVESPMGLAVAFRTSSESSASYAMSLGGRTFMPPIAIRPGERSAMPRIAFFRGGQAVYTYQTTNADYSRYWSWWRTSDDWETWRQPELVTASSQNVHDAAPVLRNDGDVDLYFIYSSLEPTDTFKLYRRCLTRGGLLGPEELVTAIGSPNKPTLKRLPGGGLLLLYSDITRTDVDGCPAEQILKMAILAGDAPRP